MLDLSMFSSLLILGAAVGVMAGLLGVGGGAIMVPAFTALFMHAGISNEQVVHLALGTSMASIIATSTASLRSHHAKKGVIWPIVRSMAPGVLGGTFLGALVVAWIDTLVLAGFFSAFMLFVAVQMFRNTPVATDQTLPGKVPLLTAGAGIGAISALVSIGGGSLTVPYLIRHSIEIKRAIGTSAAVGLPIALAGTLGYIISGWSHTNLVSLTLGFVYLPAVLCVSMVSFFTAPIGVRIAYSLPVSSLKKVFGVLVFSVSVKMFLSVL
jgi:uncharacterized membrane protein YfcA